MARTTKPARTQRLRGAYDEIDDAVFAADRQLSDDEAEIRFSLTALGEAVVSERARRRPAFRGFGPCGRVVA